METKGWKSFWCALWTTLLLLLPLVGGTLLLSQRQAAARVRASESQSGVPVALPREENHLTLLACVSGDAPAFVLLYLNAGQNCIDLLALPGELSVPFGDGTATLSACYAAAGPARCLQGLRQLAGLPEDAHYLAIAPATLESVCADFGPLRVGFSGALAPEQLARYGQSAVTDWDAGAAHSFLLSLAQDGLAPSAVAAARAAVWDAFFRQKLELLPAALPEALREESGALLTDLNAADLLTLEDTLELLANASATVESAALPGDYDERSGLYTANEETQAALAAFFRIESGEPDAAQSTAP